MGREQRISDIVTSDYNESKRIVTSDYSDYKSTKRNKRAYTASLAQAKANHIAEKLHNPSRLKFYLKCAWNLTDEYLDRLLDIASRKDDPKRYFSRAAASEMANNG